MQLNPVKVELLEFEPVENQNTESADILLLFSSTDGIHIERSFNILIVTPKDPDFDAYSVGLMDLQSENKERVHPKEFLSFYALNKHSSKIGENGFLSFDSKKELQAFLDECIESHNRILASRKLARSVSDLTFNNDLQDHEDFEFAFLECAPVAALVCFWRHKEFGGLGDLLLTFSDGVAPEDDLDTREVLKSLGLESLVRETDMAHVSGPHSLETMDQILETVLMEQLARKAKAQLDLKKLGLHFG